MIHVATTVLSEKGQVVIPAEIRERLGLRRSDRFEVHVTEDGVMLRLLSCNPLLERRGALAGEGLTDALIEERR